MPIKFNNYTLPQSPALNSLSNLDQALVRLEFLKSQHL